MEQEQQKRQAEWQRMTPEQRLRKVHEALLEFQDYAALRRLQRQLGGTRRRERDHER